MSIMELGATGEFLAAIAVLVTLVYLTIQVRFAKIAAGDLNRQARVEAIRDMTKMMLDDPSLRKSWVKANGFREFYQQLADEWDVSEDEAYVLQREATAWFWVHWAQWASIKTRGDEDEMVNIIKVFYSYPVMWRVWNLAPIQRQFDPAYVEFVNGILPTTTARQRDFATQD